MINTLLSRTLWGIAIVALGVGFLLDTLGLASFGSLMGTYWPILIILAGVLLYINNPRHYATPAFIVVVGTLFLLDRLDVIGDINVFQVIWPLALVWVGLSILFQGSKTRAPRTETTKESNTNLNAVLAGLENHVTSPDYQGGSITAILGGVGLDLRKADIKTKARLDITTFCGGVEIRVPENWRVQVSGTPVLGGWENTAAKPTSKDAPVLEITTTCMLGGIEIKN